MHCDKKIVSHKNMWHILSCLDAAAALVAAVNHGTTNHIVRLMYFRYFNWQSNIIGSFLLWRHQYHDFQLWWHAVLQCKGNFLTSLPTLSPIKISCPQILHAICCYDRTRRGVCVTVERWQLALKRSSGTLPGQKAKIRECSGDSGTVGNYVTCLTGVKLL